MNPISLQKYVSQYDPEKDIYGTDEDTILKAMYKICRDLTLFNVTDRLKTFLLLLEFNKIEFSSEMSRLQMRFIHFVQDKHTSINDDVELLKALGSSPQISGNNRLECMATLFRHSYFDEAYHIASSISIDQHLTISQRKESIFLLVGSEENQYQNDGFLACKNLIENGTFVQSRDILALLLNLGQESGLYVNIIDAKIPYEYNEECCIRIFKDYFYSSIYNIHDKLVAAQFLIQTSYVENKESQINLLEEIYRWAYLDDETIEIGMRGDCGDFLQNWSEIEEYEEKGRRIIDEMKFANVPIGMRNIYTNAENVHEHNVMEAIHKFIIERLIPNTDNVPAYDTTPTLKDISEHIYKIKKPNALYKALDSFDKIKIDNTKFTKDKIVPLDVLCYIWNYIRMKNHEKVQRKLLLNKFMQELVDMADTCTSGHIARLINVVESIQITFHQQIVANTQGRIQAKLRNMEDVDKQGDYAMALMEDATPVLKQELHDWIMSFKDDLCTELQEEFVGEEYVSQQEFDIAFNEGLVGWIK